jgi:hypothetical protein
MVAIPGFEPGPLDYRSSVLPSELYRPIIFWRPWEDSNFRKPGFVIQRSDSAELQGHGGPGRNRTFIIPVMSRLLCPLRASLSLELPGPFFLHQMAMRGGFEPPRLLRPTEQQSAALPFGHLIKNFCLFNLIYDPLSLSSHHLFIGGGTETRTLTRLFRRYWFSGPGPAPLGSTPPENLDINLPWKFSNVFKTSRFEQEQCMK